MELDPNSIIIEQAHRIGKYEHGNKRTVIAKLLNFKDKENIIAAARQKKLRDIYVNEDFSSETMKKRKELVEQMKKHRREGKYAVIQVDKLVVRERRDAI